MSNLKPILFNTAMVQAILSGQKTTTRRIIKRTPSNDTPRGYGFWREYNAKDKKWYIKDYTFNTIWHEEKGYIERYSKYHVGDILYVRETWMIQSMSNFDKRIKFMYKAEGSNDLEVRYVSFDRYNELMKYESKTGWQPSLFMPKEAARIFLKVTDVRVERLHDITDDGCKAEGCYMPCYEVGTNKEKNDKTLFKIIWDNTLKKEQIEQYGWNANPWVWVIEFEKIEKSEVE